LKKKGKSSEKVLSFSDLKRWRESTLAKNSVVSYWRLWLNDLLLAE
jgi:hypothetical protein